MIKLISAVLAGVVGAVLAVTAAWGVVHSQTAAPSTNPAAANVVQYGH